MSMVSLLYIDGRWSPQGSLVPYVDPRELEIEITLFLKDYSGAYMLSLPLSSFPTVCVGSFVSFQLCSLLFDPTYTMNFITRSLQCLISALRSEGNLTLITVFDKERKGFEVVLDF